jgi:hypothetical protein
MYQNKVRQGHGSAAVKPAEPSADYPQPIRRGLTLAAMNKQSSIPTVAYPEDLDRVDRWDAAPP